jgi:hypothetical protein
MNKIDYKKELAQLYNPSTKEPSVVDVPTMSFLTVDGAGDPNTEPAYQSAVEALYAVSYTLKFMVKKGTAGVDYGVMPLEGLWWVDDITEFSYDDRRNWRWTMMIMQPEMITSEMVDQAKTEVTRKKGLDLSSLRYEKLDEGRAAQIMHLGPYSAEPPTIERLHAFIAAQGLEINGKHHEIYLSDPRRIAPEKMKTIIRYPVGDKEEGSIGR